LALDPGLQPGAGIIRKQLGGDLIQPLAIQRDIHFGVVLDPL
jgi:hypothetical protein